MITKDDLYFCYSSKQSKFLSDKGIKYLFLAMDLKGKPFSLYEKNDQLFSALTEYKLNK
jgi:hypothetical protein